MIKYILVFILFMIPGIVWPGGYHKTVNNYYSENVTNITNFTGVSNKDLATIGALTGAASGHQFMRATESLQWSISGSCLDSSSDDCGLSGALAKRTGDVLWTGILSGASNERLLVISVGGTFD